MARRWSSLMLLAVLGLVLAGLGIFLTVRPQRGMVEGGQREFPGAALARPATAAHRSVAGEWRLPAGDYASTRYSPLAEIARDNVGRLKPAFTFDTGLRRGHEAAPLVIGATMYIVTPFPNIVYALDLTRPERPVKWRFDPRPDTRAQGIACCDVVNRGMSYDNGRLFFATLDGQAIALDTASGREVWRTRLADIAKGETVTMAPLAAGGKVLVGNSGGEFGVRGWLAALDAATGKEVWRAWSTGPDKDVLIGPDFHPFYASDRGKDLGVRTWPAEGWKKGGGTVWGWISYDPELRLIYYGTSNPGPWNPEERPGDNKWTSGVFARDIDTGTARWFYQSNPHDLFDHDDINEHVLLDLPFGGRMRKVLVHPGRTGYMYVIDRVTGEVLSANAFAAVTAYEGVDLKTGRIRPAAAKQPRAGRVVRGICPAAPGGKEWNPSAFSPRTGLLYVPHLNLCMDHGLTEANYVEGTPYLGAESKFYAGPGGHRGVFTAWDPVRGKAVWQLREDLPLWSGALVTAGDVVFYGTLDGWFKALDARTGKLLWKYHTESGIVGQPITYRGPDGRQYVAVLSGVGGWVGALVAGGLDPGDPTGGLGMFRAVDDLPARTERGGKLYVFALPR